MKNIYHTPNVLKYLESVLNWVIRRFGLTSLNTNVTSQTPKPQLLSVIKSQMITRLTSQHTIRITMRSLSGER